MKTFMKALLLFTVFSSVAVSQVVVSKPDVPEALVWGSGDLSEKEEQEYLGKITNPQLKQMLQEIKKLDKRKYYSLLRKTSYMSAPSLYTMSGENIVFNRDSEASDLRKKISELEIYTEVLAVKYKNANQQNDKSKLAEQLKQTLNQIFDLRETQRKEEIEKLEKNLAELKESIKIRNDNKKQIVEERFRTLTGKSKYLKWD